MHFMQTYRLFFLVVTLWILGGLKMSKAATWVLGDEPLPDNEITATIDLYSEEKPMGPDLPPRKLVEAKVEPGKHHIYLPPHTAKSVSSESGASSGSKWDFYLVHVPFTLYPPPGDKHYQKLRFSISLDNNLVTAFKLLPDNITVEEDVKKTYDLSSVLKFKDLEGKAGFGYEVTFKNLKPIITAFGEGKNDFSWEYTSQQGQYVLPGNKQALIILEAPHGTKTVNGKVYYEAIIEEEWFGKWRPKETKSDYYPVHWDLSSAEPSSKIPWSE